MSSFQRSPAIWMAGYAAIFGTIAYVGGGPAAKYYGSRGDRVAMGALLGALLPLVVHAYQLP